MNKAANREKLAKSFERVVAKQKRGFPLFCDHRSCPLYTNWYFSIESVMKETDANIQSWITLELNRQKQQQKGESKKGQGNSQKTMRNLSKKLAKEKIQRGKNAKEAGKRKNSDGGYSPEKFLIPSQLHFWEQKALDFINKYRIKKKYKEENIERIIPDMFFQLPNIIPKVFEETKQLPLVLLRYRLTGYMTSDFKMFCSALKLACEKNKIPFLFMKGFDKVSKKRTSEYISIETLLKIPSTKLLIPTCGCKGGGRFDTKLWNQIEKKHKVFVFTHYSEFDNCGCSTFRKMHAETQIPVTHNFLTSQEIVIQNK